MTDPTTSDDLVERLLASDAAIALTYQAAREIERLRADRLDGNRPLPFDRETLGRFAREAWMRWAYQQPHPKESWLVPYDLLSEPDREADRQIGEAIARWTLIGDAARAAQLKEQP
jgi:hypothetical protein